MVYQQLANNGNGGLKEVLVNRPPTVMFLLCIASCALATMSISFYFKLTNDEIHNPDVLGWNTLLTEISNMNFCLLNSSITADLHPPTNDNNIMKNTQDMIIATKESAPIDSNVPSKNVNVSLKLPISAKFAESLQYIDNVQFKYEDILASSEISLMDMSRAVPPKYHQHKIRILLNLPQPAISNTSHRYNGKDGAFACFNVEAPLSLFQDLNSSMPLQQECSIHQNSGNSLPRKLLAHTGDRLPPSWCNQIGASPIHLDYYQEPLWTVFITSEDKKLINLHLMATSVFLFALLGVIILVFFVKGLFGGSRKLHSQRYSTENINSDVSLTRINSA